MCIYILIENNWFGFHVQGAVDNVSQYGSIAVPHGAYDMQRAHVHRQAVS